MVRLTIPNHSSLVVQLLSKEVGNRTTPSLVFNLETTDNGFLLQNHNSITNDFCGLHSSCNFTTAEFPSFPFRTTEQSHSMSNEGSNKKEESLLPSNVVNGSDIVMKTHSNQSANCSSLSSLPSSVSSSSSDVSSTNDITFVVQSDSKNDNLSPSGVFHSNITLSYSLSNNNQNPKSNSSNGQLTPSSRPNSCSSPPSGHNFYNHSSNGYHQSRVLSMEGRRSRPSSQSSFSEDRSSPSSSCNVVTNIPEWVLTTFSPFFRDNIKIIMEDITSSLVDNSSNGVTKRSNVMNRVHGTTQGSNHALLNQELIRRRSLQDHLQRKYLNSTSCHVIKNSYGCSRVSSCSSSGVECSSSSVQEDQEEDLEFLTGTCSDEETRMENFIQSRDKIMANENNIEDFLEEEEVLNFSSQEEEEEGLEQSCSSNVTKEVQSLMERSSSSPPYVISSSFTTEWNRKDSPVTQQDISQSSLNQCPFSLSSSPASLNCILNPITITLSGVSYSVLRVIIDLLSKGSTEVPFSKIDSVKEALKAFGVTNYSITDFESKEMRRKLGVMNSNNRELKPSRVFRSKSVSHMMFPIRESIIESADS